MKRQVIQQSWARVQGEVRWVRFAQACSLVAMALATWGVLAWLMGRPGLTAWAAHPWPVSPRSALALVLIGSALGACAGLAQSKAERAYVTATVTGTFLLIAWSLLEVFPSFQLGIEARVFPLPAGMSSTSIFPMSFVTAFCLGLAGVVLLGLTWRPGGWLASGAGGCGVLLLLVTLVVLLGHFYGARPLFEGSTRPVSLLAAIATVWVGLGLVAAAGPRRLPLRALLGRSIRARLLRILVPTTFVLMLLVELLPDLLLPTQSVHPALHNALRALLASAIVVTAVLLVARSTGRALDQAEAQTRAAHEELERRVEERTAELTAANQELRAQIVRRQQIEDELRESLATFAALGETVPILVMIHRQGKCLYTNQAAETLLGRSREDLRRCLAWDLVRPDHREIARERILGREGGELGLPIRREYPFVTPDGRTVWLDIAAARIEFEGQPAVLACGLDLTDRKRAEEFLQASEERFRTLFEFAPIGIALHAPNGRYVQVNHAYCDMLGYPAEELLRLGPRRVTLPEDVPEGRRLYQELLVGQRDHYGREKRYRHRTGQVVWAFSAASAVRDGDGRLRYIVSMVLDITERKRLQSEILEISARERRRLGYNLHDGLGQHLSGTAFKAKCLEEALGEAAPAQAAAAEEIVQLINRAISQTRALARGLDPIEVEVGGLVSALQGLTSESEKLFAIRCRFSCNCPAVPLDAPQALHLFHIVQEAINNAARHGAARHIEVELTAANGQLRLAIRDDGKGFATGPQPATGLGMRTMRYRADSIGASLRVRSRPVRGVEVECVLAAPGPVEPTGQEP